jgi:Domain of unknown function (DUF4926)
MAAITKHAIGEHDVVAFTEKIAKAESTGSWPAGTIGAVISDYGEAKLIDIVGKDGATLDMPTVPVDKLELVEQHSNTNGSIPAKRQKRRKPQRVPAARSSVA